MLAFMFEDRHPMLPKCLLPSFFQLWERDLILSLPYHGGDSWSPFLFQLWALKTEPVLQMWANQRTAQLDAASCVAAVGAALSDFRFWMKLF